MKKNNVLSIVILGISGVALALLLIVVFTGIGKQTVSPAVSGASSLLSSAASSEPEAPSETFSSAVPSLTVPSEPVPSETVSSEPIQSENSSLEPPVSNSSNTHVTVDDSRLYKPAALPKSGSDRDYIYKPERFPVIPASYTSDRAEQYPRELRGLTVLESDYTDSSVALMKSRLDLIASLSVTAGLNTLFIEVPSSDHADFSPVDYIRSSSDGKKLKIYLIVDSKDKFDKYILTAPDGILLSFEMTHGELKAVRQAAANTELGIITSALDETAKQFIAGAQINFIMPVIDSGNFMSAAKAWIDATVRTDIMLYIISDLSDLGNEIAADTYTSQITSLRKITGYNGVVFSDYNAFRLNTAAIRDSLTSLFNAPERKNENSLTVNWPMSSSFSTPYASVYLTGASDPDYPLYLNGNEVETTANGLFSVKVSLKSGSNSFTFKNGSSTVVKNIRRTSSSGTSASAYVDTTELVKFLNSSSENTERRVAVVSGELSPMFYGTLPVRDYKNAFYASPGTMDYIVGEVTSYNYESETTLEVYKLSCGYYIEKSKVTVLDDTELSAGRITETEFTVTDECFNIRIQANANLPVTIDKNAYNAGKVEIKLHNVAEYTAAEYTIPDNVLFRSASAKLENGILTYTLELKKGEYFGYTVTVDNGVINISFKNPLQIKSGSFPLEGIKIALDPGHGAFTGGSHAPDYPDDNKERELNYKTAILIKNYLEQLGAEVEMSRTDKYPAELTPPVQVRKWFKELDADIAIGVHYNAVDTNANPFLFTGVLGLYANCHSKSLSDIIAQNTAYYASRPYRGSSEGNYIICNTADIPAIILECGYVSNIHEYNWSIIDQNRDALARSVAMSVLDYFEYQTEFYK